MRFTAAVAAATLAGAASASYAPAPPAGYAHGHSDNSTASDVYVTEVVTAYTTYCPEPTSFVHAGETYTVSEATTLTITNCPGGCTVTKPMSSSVVSVCHDCEETAPPAPVPTTESAVVPPVEEPSSPAAPVEPSTPAAPVEPSTPAAPVNPAPYPSSNGTTSMVVMPTGTGAPEVPSETTGAPVEGSTGAADKAFAAAGAAGVALFGLFAAL